MRVNELNHSIFFSSVSGRLGMSIVW